MTIVISTSRATIYCLLVVSQLIVVALRLSAEEERQLPDYAASSWVVTDSYDGGRNTKSSVGLFIVVANGKLHLASPKDGVATYVLKPLWADVGERFEMQENGVRYGSALLIRERGKTTLFINQSNPVNGKVQIPESKVDKCDEAFICTPITDAQARDRLAKYGNVP